MAGADFIYVYLLLTIKLMLNVLQISLASGVLAKIKDDPQDDLDAAAAAATHSDGGAE